MILFGVYTLLFVVLLWEVYWLAIEGLLFVVLMFGCFACYFVVVGIVLI